MGTEIMRDFLPTLFPSFENNIWVKRFEKTYRGDQKTCVADGRNETMSIKKLGGIVIRITRPEILDHESEKNIDSLTMYTTMVR